MTVFTPWRVDGFKLAAFARHAWRRFSGDQCLRLAASLSYTSLLAIVPLTAIAFSMLAAFPVFEGMREQFQEMVFANVLPQSAEAMRDYFDRFVRNATGLTAVGIVGLALTAVLLLGTIESALNAIFRVTRPRPLVPRLLVFWALITLGPLMLGASFSLSAYFFALTRFSGIGAFTGPLGELALAVPTLIVMGALLVFYLAIPNRPVSLAAALVGGGVGGLLFSGLRGGFGYYVAHFPTYQTIYGALSAVPIFLIWMYLSWTVVLLGAVLAACADEWRAAGGPPVNDVSRSGPRLVMALTVLRLLLAASRSGEAVGRRALLRGTGAAEAVLDRVLALLGAGRFVVAVDGGGWVLARDPTTTTLYELYVALGSGLTEDDASAGAETGLAALDGPLGALRAAQGTTLNVPLRAVLEGHQVG